MLRLARNFVVSILFTAWKLVYLVLLVGGTLAGVTIALMIFIYPGILAGRYWGIDTTAMLGLSFIAWIVLMLIAWKTGFFKLLDKIKEGGWRLFSATDSAVENYLDGLRR